MNTTDDRWLEQNAGWVTQSCSLEVDRSPSFTLSSTERKALLFSTDLLLVNGVLLLAVSQWNGFVLSREYLLAYGKWFITLSLLWIVLGLAMDIYDPLVTASSSNSVLYTGITSVVVGVTYWLIPWFTPEPGRRMLVLGFMTLMVLVVSVWRVVYATLFCQSSFQRRVLLVGDDKLSMQIACDVDAAAGVERANPFRGTGYQIIGLTRTLLPKMEEGLDPAHLLVRLIRQKAVHEILITDPATLSPIEKESLLDCREIGIQVRPLSSVYEKLTGRLPVEYALRDIDLIVNGDENPSQRLYFLVKRASDIILAMFGLGIIGLIAPIIALINAITSPGPLFYRQTRVGAGGRPFALVKFRTMSPYAEKPNQAVWAQKNDARVTFLGRWMRKFRIDELPQVINVLKGEMSIIGPRPERPQFVGEISRQLPIYRSRHSVKPGITGWAQVYYHYGSSIEDARIKLEYDLYYIKHAGFWVDLLILLRTLPTMLMMRGQ